MTKFWSIIFVLLLVIGGAQLQAQTDQKVGKSGSSAISKEWLSGSWLARDGTIGVLVGCFGEWCLHLEDRQVEWRGRVLRDRQMGIGQRPFETNLEERQFRSDRGRFLRTRARLGRHNALAWWQFWFEHRPVSSGQRESNFATAGWLVGTWTTLAGFESYTFELQADGRFAYKKEAGLTSQAENGEGNWTFEKGVLIFTGGLTGTYNVRPFDDTGFNATTATDSNGLLFKRSNSEPRDPFKPLNFAGQYIQQGTTLTITGKGDAYEAKLLVQGNTGTLTGRATGDTLELSDANGKVLYQLRLDNNGLRNTNLYQISNKFYLKIAETTLSTPNKLVGYWLQTERFSQDNDLLLLPDGRYRQTAHYQLVGRTSISVTEGCTKSRAGKSPWTQPVPVRARMP